MHLAAQFQLLSDAQQLAVTGGGFWLLALFAYAMDRRRMRSRDVERLENVGWVPWTGIFMLAAIMGGGCLALSLPVVIGNL